MKVFHPHFIVNNFIERETERKREREIDEKERERLMASFLLNVPPPLGVGLYHI